MGKISEIHEMDGRPVLLEAQIGPDGVTTGLLKVKDMADAQYVDNFYGAWVGKNMQGETCIMLDLEYFYPDGTLFYTETACCKPWQTEETT